jgi:hypothetical protein
VEVWRAGVGALPLLAIVEKVLVEGFRLEEKVL